jgi:hypothetical protein
MGQPFSPRGGGKDDRKRVLMGIAGEWVEDPFQMSDHSHLPLCEGMPHRHQDPTGVGPASDGEPKLTLREERSAGPKMSPRH